MTSKSTPPSQKTSPHFFILESLTLKDETSGRFEGKQLYNYLKLLNKKPQYYYIQSRRELEKMAIIFRETGYRYLYISCHGNEHSLNTTFDTIPFHDFSEIFDKRLEHRRVFISGCSLGQQHFAETLFSKNGGMYSITAPKEMLNLSKCCRSGDLFFTWWSPLIQTLMKGSAIYPSLQLCSNMFDVDMIHFYKKTGKGIISKNFIAEYVFSDEQLKNSHTD